MISADLSAMTAGWIAKGSALVKTFGPYALLEFLLPGGSLIALGLWLYRHRRHRTPTGVRHAAATHAIGRLASSWRPIVIASAAGALTAGCTVGPDFVRPEPPPAAYSRSLPPAHGTSGFAYGEEVAGDWYRLFRSDALDRLVRQALVNNPDLEGARHGLAAAQDELKAVSGSALPQIDAAGQIGRAHINGSELYAPVKTLDATGNRYEAGPTLAYDLDLFGGVRRSIESQRAQTAAVDDQLRDTYVTLVDQVVITAFDYAAVRAQIRVTRSLVSELQAQYALTVQLENAGKIIHSDTLQAETQLENVRATLPGLEQQRDAYRNVLARLSGRTPDEFRMPALTLAEFTLPTSLPVSLPSALVQQRPDVLAAQERLHAASAEIGVAEAARLPQLSLSARYAQQSTRLSELFTQPGGVWSVGLGLAAPLFHGGTLAARADEAKQRYTQALFAYRGTVIDAFVDVADALQALQHDADSYTAHERALQAASANQDLAAAEYRAGKYTELQVLTAEQQYQSAALTQVQADVQRFTDTAALFRALGGGWWNVSDRALLGSTAGVDPAPNTDRHNPTSSGSSHD
ncbi:MAG TPA: efflux transporter outer membrane subunit [Steroidobacteraceae bacterium]|nr:efflux transporter outer membrane subunit [Steroidobacteraceae bacterium]